MNCFWLVSNSWFQFIILNQLNKSILIFATIYKQNLQSKNSDNSKMQGYNKATITSLITGGRRRLVYVYEDGRQMIEEYDMRTHQLLFRKHKKPSTFKQAKWQIEAGQQQSSQKIDPQIIMKSNNAPLVVRKDALQAFQWRIRNLPYPQQVYQLEVDSEKQQIVIKTTIKKYYKRFQIPDMLRANIKLNKENLSFKHNNNTLIVSYKKPEVLLSKQLQMRKQFQKLNTKKPKEGDIECTTQ